MIQITKQQNYVFISRRIAHVPRQPFSAQVPNYSNSGSQPQRNATQPRPEPYRPQQQLAQQQQPPPSYEQSQQNASLQQYRIPRQQQPVAIPLEPVDDFPSPVNMST